MSDYEFQIIKVNGGDLIRELSPEQIAEGQKGFYEDVTNWTGPFGEKIVMLGRDGGGDNAEEGKKKRVKAARAFLCFVVGFLAALVFFLLVRK